MDPISSALITKALDGLSLRMEAAAANIANANSRAYRPTHVTFEASLRAAANRGADAIRSVKPSIETATLETSGGEARLDLELADASESAMRYGALIDMLGRQMDIMRAAVRGGQS